MCNVVGRFGINCSQTIGAHDEKGVWSCFDPSSKRVVKDIWAIGQIGRRYIPRQPRHELLAVDEFRLRPQEY